MSAPTCAADIRQGLQQGLLLGAAVLVLALPVQRAAPPGHAPGGVSPPGAHLVRRLDFAGLSPSADTRQLARWVVDGADNADLPFAIVDKREARLYLFEPGGQLVGTAPVLLGFARGDDSVPGIGERPVPEVRPFERTTPAGRFETRPGHNAAGDIVLWVDHAAAVSMHRLRPTDASERRPQRLATPTALDNRITYGCINLPPEFFETTFWPRFGHGASVVYVLPETRPLHDTFAAVATRARVAQW